MSEPTPDLFDICVVLNEATDARLGADLLPFAERVKAIVIEALAGTSLAIPSDAELGDIYDKASGEYAGPRTFGNRERHLAGIAAVREALTAAIAAARPVDERGDR